MAVIVTETLSGIPVYSLAANGADPTGATANDSIIDKLLTAASNAGGGIFYAGVGAWGWSAAHVIPGGVNVVGAGGNGGLPYSAHITPATRFVALAAAAQLAWGERTIEYRYGRTGGFAIDGNLLAIQPAYWGFVIETLFEDIQLLQAAGINAVFEAPQNCRYVNFGSINPDGLCLLLDYGAQENSFKCELRGGGADGTGNVLIQQSGVSPAGAGLTPIHNVFEPGSVIEQPAAAAAYTIAQTNGELNRIACTVADTAAPGARPLIKVTRADLTQQSSLLTIASGATLHGTQNRTTFIDVAGAPNKGSSVVWDGFVFIENALQVLKCDANSQIFLYGAPQTPELVSGITRFYADATTQAHTHFETAHATAADAAPAGTVSLVPVMAGIACAFTPQLTGRAVITIEGYMGSDTIAAGVQVQGAYGTGAAPVNGAAAAGTTFGLAQDYIAATAAERAPFSVTTIVTGLTVGVAYWIDLQFSALTGGTATLYDVEATALEA